MSDVVASFQDAGCASFRTHGQRGNVLFETVGTGGLMRESSIEDLLRGRFGIPILVVIRSRDELAAIVAAAPPDHASDSLRSDVFFLKDPLTAEAVYAELPELREGVDSNRPRRPVLLSC